jgi:hypothetical protein
MQTNHKHEVTNDEEKPGRFFIGSLFMLLLG